MQLPHWTCVKNRCAVLLGYIRLRIQLTVDRGWSPRCYFEASHQSFLMSDCAIILEYARTKPLAYILSTFYFNLATYDWPLAKLYNSNKLRELLTGKVAIAKIDGNFLHTSLGVVTREKAGFLTLENTSKACLGNLDLCEFGLSVSFWMNFKGG